ncbi:ATP-dependent zinc metalloprotease FtsH [Acidiferrimicrobium sp. IK]|uniref:ATP-dependent zinc metalloprotease FtsH n=1 Tax=Acidiferrimicrobium sp. IK TaxID=2871700 RepID=UPI0021CAEF73|nr:ATP-dependent zinc metalloprotease FtsH [Acidiferrimicrobium sp. IK]MCU4184117.1 ATP-dependent zinc metalloprotease FtsH [Acidiferrimicrobium sp. IK]
MSPKQVHYSAPAKSGPPSDRRPAPAPPPPPPWRPWLLLVGLVLTILLFVLSAVGGQASTPKSLTFSDFQTDVTNDSIKTATISSTGHVSGTFVKGGDYTSQIPTALQDTKLSSLLTDHHVQITGTAPSSGLSLGVVLLDLLPLVFLLGLFWWVGRRAKKQLGGAGIGGGLMGFGGSKAKVYDEDRPTTRFSDVAGYEGAKQEVLEVVDFLKNPQRYEKAGAVGPKGVLMVGPPGTGKTLMARAVAGEADVPFLALTGSSFVEMFVGVGASRVRDLFADARKRAPSIVFIDEIDAIGGKRGAGFGFGGNDEREQTLNQMLAEMDGFDPATGVVVIAATNRPESLDPALLRPGRFDRTVEIPLPNLIERRAILAVHAKDKHLGPDVDLDVVARGTPGFSGADLANLVNEAAVHAVRDNRSVIEAGDFDAARDRLLLGRRESSNALLPEEKHSVAVHETGHALVAVLSPHADPVAKVTILPAGQALGVTEQLPETERHLYPESYLRDSLAVRLGGRAAELIVLGEASTGASNDLAGATQLATRMVREWGLSPRLGPIGYSNDGPGYLGESGLSARPYAEATQRAIDEEVAALLRQAEERATELLSSHRAELDRIVELLIDREIIDGDDLMAIVDPGRAAKAAPLAPIPTASHRVSRAPGAGTGSADGQG